MGTIWGCRTKRLPCKQQLSNSNMQALINNILRLNSNKEDQSEHLLNQEVNSIVSLQEAVHPNHYRSQADPSWIQRRLSRHLKPTRNQGCNLDLIHLRIDSLIVYSLIKEADLELLPSVLALLEWRQVLLLNLLLPATLAAWTSTHSDKCKDQVGTQWVIARFYKDWAHTKCRANNAVEVRSQVRRPQKTDWGVKAHSPSSLINKQRHNRLLRLQLIKVEARRNRTSTSSSRWTLVELRI